MLEKFPRREISVAILLLCLATATAAADSAGSTAAVEFNDAFLHHAPGEQIDISRFSQGNVALPGDYRAELYVNQNWVGRTDVVLRSVGGDTRNIQPCFDRTLLELVGVDLTRLKSQAAAQLQQNSSTCIVLPTLIEPPRESWRLVGLS